MSEINIRPHCSLQSPTEYLFFVLWVYVAMPNTCRSECCLECVTTRGVQYAPSTAYLGRPSSPQASLVLRVCRKPFRAVTWHLALMSEQRSELPVHSIRDYTTIFRQRSLNDRSIALRCNGLAAGDRHPTDRYLLPGSILDSVDVLLVGSTNSLAIVRAEYSMQVWILSSHAKSLTPIHAVHH